MRRSLKTLTLAGIVAVSTGLGLGTSSAKAQGFGYPGGGYRGGYYAVPSTTYYGNGGHDLQPHMHTRQGLFGNSSSYGLGRHDFRPHAHVETPYGITGYSNGPFRSTQSYSPPTPYGYRPW